MDMEKFVFLRAFYALVFAGKFAFKNPGHPRPRPEKVWNRDDLPLVGKDQVREHLNRLDIQKSVGPDRMHLWVLMELANVTVRPLSIIFGKS